MFVGCGMSGRSYRNVAAACYAASAGLDGFKGRDQRGAKKTIDIDRLRGENNETVDCNIAGFDLCSIINDVSRRSSDAEVAHGRAGCAACRGRGGEARGED